jgi:IS30 family transposase
MHSTSPHFCQLQPEDRITLASLQQQKYSVCAIARVLHRSPSTISRELVACLRQAHKKRTPRSKSQDRRGQIPDMLSIHVRPSEIEDRQFPRH